MLMTTWNKHTDMMSSENRPWQDTPFVDEAGNSNYIISCRLG